MIRPRETGSGGCSVADYAINPISLPYLLPQIYPCCMYTKFKMILLKANSDKAEFKVRFIKYGAFALRFVIAF
jgi:hypothetical protein